jgi:hypothetical protein
VTSNGAMNWTAAVQETVDATLNRVISSGIRWAGACGAPGRHAARAHGGKPVTLEGASAAASAVPEPGGGGGGRARCPWWHVRLSLRRARPLPLPSSSGASYYEGSFSNISRNQAGDYVAVSSRGNFFMTWSPGGTGLTAGQLCLLF